MQRVVSAWISRALGAVFLTAALLKAASPEGALVSVTHLTGVSNQFATATVTAVILAEICVGSMLICIVLPGLAIGLSTAMLAGFSVVLALLASDPWAPSCACLGSLELADDARTSNLLGLARNGVMLAACAFLLRRPPEAADPKIATPGSISVSQRTPRVRNDRVKDRQKNTRPRPLRPGA